jgi:SAM-dependent methyltransferase
MGPVIELGCGVGGLARMLKPHVSSYLGVDSSFASVALGRHLALGAPHPRPIRIPGDLLAGAVSREVAIAPARGWDGSIDLVVADLEALPVGEGRFDIALALNTIDMLAEPEVLPRYQHALLAEDGVAIQSCPYIWHESVARALRERIPPAVSDSAGAVEWLYEQSGFEIGQSIPHLPWLFFKHLRQLEIYSVHLFIGHKRARKR